MASLGSPQGGGPAPITVRVREDKGKMGDMQVRVTGVRGEKQDDEYDGPWGAKGPLWFFARLMTFITCVAIISTRSWARGGKYRIDIDYQFENLGNGKSSERVFLERSEVGIVSACYKGWSASSRVGPLAAEQCDYVFSGMKWDEDAMLVALIFAVLFILVLSYRLSYEATELFFPGFVCEGCNANGMGVFTHNLTTANTASGVFLSAVESAGAEARVLDLYAYSVCVDVFLALPTLCFLQHLTASLCTGGWPS